MAERIAKTWRGFAGPVRAPSPLRDAITAAYRRAEPDCLPTLIDAATLPADARATVAARTRALVAALRAKGARGPVESLIQEYSLSSQEGVALMCLAEALLRIPDRATRDALIRDKIAPGDWSRHLGASQSVFVNAATWGLLVTGRLTATHAETGLSAALTRLIGRGGEPLIRAGVDIAMRMMGEQFVTGQTIDEALANSRALEAKGFRHSYDMLGEAATTADDAARYYASYEAAIHAIGTASAGRGIYEGPGISIKLSALHPRYSRAKIDRVMAELLPRVRALASLAKRYDIGLNIDAEEADRLELSLDLLDALCADTDLADWNGLGFVIQAYQKRCFFVVDWLIELARRSKRRLMVRLVKGAYWDSEIKRAQVDGLEDFPVFTRKVHTDVSYLACARKLLAAPDAVFPQFATHNAQTLASVISLGGPNFYRGQYEFQCLHGMGEPLYGEVVGDDKLGRPCRIYAPVGDHETLLAYLVRRLLENGANTSFVNRIADKAVPIDDLTQDPVALASAVQPLGAPHPKIALPRALYGGARDNSIGLDLSNEATLRAIGAALQESAGIGWRAAPTGAGSGASAPVTNPADRSDIVGHAQDASPADIDRALRAACASAARWAATPAGTRCAALRRAADALERRMTILLGLIAREAGKSIPNAIGEVREAVDFLRYYANEAEHGLADAHPLGPVVCISPWNFPLAIFLGQVAAALAVGNPVLAKPAEETPLIAAEAVRLLHAAGVPDDVLLFVPGAGAVGAALVGDARVEGVMFTGSTQVARLIQRQLAERLGSGGRPVTLIAETGGQNAMIVDSSALAEQVVGDVIASAFDSAGQRCSALRILCLQEEVADRTLGMLEGAMRELAVGDPAYLATDVGPVITAEAQAGIEAHIATMRGRGHRVERLMVAGAFAHGTFVAPTLIEIGKVADVEREVFGPVLHVLRYERKDRVALVEAINATGYALTFGLHTRIDETIRDTLAAVDAGNVYVNRNVIGAVVGVQPFGGSGLSGTGPKAGGPLYLRRLVAPTERGPVARGAAPPNLSTYRDWLTAKGCGDLSAFCAQYGARSALGAAIACRGPVGESNLYSLRAKGRVAILAASDEGALRLLGALLATGNQAVVEAGSAAARVLVDAPREIAASVDIVADWITAQHVTAAIVEGGAETLLAAQRAAAARNGAIVPVISADFDIDLDRLLEERSVSVNTAAAGGNASLMTIG